MNAAPVTETALRSVDLIDDVYFLGAALKGAVHERDLPIKIQRVEPNWIRYIDSFDEAARVVVVRAELNDHVPTVLKVRALTAVDALPIIVSKQISTQHALRLYQAGAAAVLSGKESFEDLVKAIFRAGPARAVPRRYSLSEVHLTDRELQTAALYTGSTAPSARVISELLGLPLASVRTYLQRARAALREMGPTSTRNEFGSMLAAAGWINEEES